MMYRSRAIWCKKSELPWFLARASTMMPPMARARCASRFAKKKRRFLPPQSVFHVYAPPDRGGVMDVLNFHAPEEKTLHGDGVRSDSLRHQSRRERCR